MQESQQVAKSLQITRDPEAEAQVHYSMMSALMWKEIVQYELVNQILHFQFHLTVKKKWVQVDFLLHVVWEINYVKNKFVIISSNENCL